MPIYIWKIIQMDKMIKAPLEKESNELKYQIGIIVPSTNFDKKISNVQFQNRIKGTKKFFSQLFGGTSSIKEIGSYLSDNKVLINEQGVLVESSMTLEQYKKNKTKIEKYIKQKRKDWNQERIGFWFEDSFYVYPK